MAYYCLINHPRRFIACVDPKCGSYTVRDWFNHTFSEPRTEVDRNYQPDMIPAETVADFDGYRKIFFVRDPLRRLVSFYRHWVVLDEEHWCFADRDGRVGLQGRTFSEFVQVLEDLAARDLPFQHHLEPQTRVLGAIELDDVVRLEELDERMVAVNAALGVSYQPRRLNAREYGVEPCPDAATLTPAELREHKPFSLESFYDDELGNRTRQIYAADVRFYDRHSPVGDTRAPAS